MVIGNGFISENKELALLETKKRAKGDDVRLAVMPPLCSMTYFVSNIGEMFGCQQMKNFCLTKPLKIEQRYSPGCNIRYSVSGGKQKAAYMQYIMYSTFVSGEWSEDLKLNPKDGNVYNYQLNNIEEKKENYSIFVHNLIQLQHVFRSNFKEVAWFVRYVSSEVDFEDAKDIASNTFYELCNIPYPYNPDNFIGLWKDQTRKRTLDFIASRFRFAVNVLFEDGEERFSSPENFMEVENVWLHIHGDKRKRTMKLFSEGMTPTEIAEEMGVTLGTVSSCITRTLRHLQSVYRTDIAIL